MGSSLSDHTAHIYSSSLVSICDTTSSGAFCGVNTTYSTSVLSKRHPRKSSQMDTMELYMCSVVRDDPIHYKRREKVLMRDQVS
jgi:hypothetical protein